MNKQELFVRELVVEIREWKGTPWIHQGRLKGVGADCLFVLYVAVLKAGLPIHEDHKCVNYGRLPFKNSLVEGIKYYATEVKQKDMQAGDFIVFTLLKEPQHIALFTCTKTIIHSDANTGRVVEHGLDPKWKKRIHSVWRIKEL